MSEVVNRRRPSGMKALVLTGLITGAVGAAVLPALWELIVGSFGLSPRWLGQYVLVFVFGGVAAAPIWGLLGATAGYCAGLLWRRKANTGHRRAVTRMALAVAAIMGVPTGLAVGSLSSSFGVGLGVGVLTAAVAVGAMLLVVRRLIHADQQQVTSPRAEPFE